MSEIPALETEIAAEARATLPGDDLAAPGPSPWQRFEPTILGAGSIAALLLAWELVPHLVTLSAGTQLFFATPSQVAGTLWTMFASGAIWRPLGVSASGFALGLGLAILVGFPLGVLIGRSPTLNAMLDPFVTAFNATPRLVFLPLVVLWFGLGLWSKVVIVFIGALFPILINTYEGVRNADKVLINVVRSFGAKEWDIARLVVVPNALPYIVAGLRLAIGRAVLGVVVAEFFGSEEGLGVIMVQAAGRYQVAVVFAGLIVFATLSLAMTALVQLVEIRLSRWRPQAASQF
jgi:NitT/TauT family transport system permease protein